MPAVEIDLEADDASLKFDAILLWPFDPVARANFLVTVAAQVMQNAQDEVPRRIAGMLPNIAARLATATGSSVEDAQAIVKALASERVPDAVSTIHAEITKHLFLPSGGYGRVAEAGGKDAIFKSAMDNGANFGRACGELLVYIVAINKHHPHIKTASINRTLYIMAENSRKHRQPIPAVRHRKTMWKPWGGVAPLWAARMFCASAAKARGARSIPLNDLVGASLWLADFAVTFKPIGAKAPLLSEDKVIRLKCNLEAVEPEIPPLTDEQLKWATDYLAPEER
jgi:hypothetical protein